jgi:hypothetical protein
MSVAQNPHPHPTRHFYRVHANGWVSIVTRRSDREFAFVTARDGEGGRVRTAADVVSAQRLADAAVPMGHICAGECTAWFEVTDPSQRVDFVTKCAKGHSGALSYSLGDVLFRLNTLSFWCLQCGRSWPATDEQRRDLLERVLHTIGSPPE